MPLAPEEFAAIEQNVLGKTQKPSAPKLGAPVPKMNVLSPEDFAAIESDVFRGEQERRAQKALEQEAITAAENERKAKQYGGWGGQAIARGIYGTGASLSGLGSMLGEATNIEPLKQSGAEGYRYWSDKSAEIPGVQFREIDSPLKAGKWAIEKALENAPYMLASFGAAGIGTKVASKVLPKVAGAYLAKQAVKKAGEGATSEIIATTANNIARGIGAKAGVIASTAALEGGGDYADLVERGLGSDKAVVSTIGTGIIKGFIETAGGNQRIIEKLLGTESSGMFRKALNGLRRAVATGKTPGPEHYNIIRRTMLEAMRIGTEEGIEEVGQEIVGLANIGINDPNFKMFTAENLGRIIEAGAGGFAVGGIMGAGSGAITNRAKFAKERGWIEPPYDDGNGTGNLVNTDTGEILSTDVELETKPKSRIPLPSINDTTPTGAADIIGNLDVRINELSQVKGATKLKEYNAAHPDAPITIAQKAKLLKQAKSDREKWNDWDKNPELVGMANLRATEIESGAIQPIIPTAPRTGQEQPISATTEQGVIPNVNVAQIGAEAVTGVPVQGKEKGTGEGTQTAAQAQEIPAGTGVVNVPAQGTIVPVPETPVIPVQENVPIQETMPDQFANVSNMIPAEQATALGITENVRESGIYQSFSKKSAKALNKAIDDLMQQQNVDLTGFDEVTQNAIIKQNAFKLSAAVAALEDKTPAPKGVTGEEKAQALQVEPSPTRKADAGAVTTGEVTPPPVTDKPKIIDVVRRHGKRYKVLKHPDGKMELYRSYGGVKERLPYDEAGHQQDIERMAKKRTSSNKYIYVSPKLLGSAARIYLKYNGTKLDDGTQWDELVKLWDGIRIAGHGTYNKNRKADRDRALYEWKKELEAQGKGSGEGTGLAWDTTNNLDKLTDSDMLAAARVEIDRAISGKRAEPTIQDDIETETDIQDGLEEAARQSWIDMGLTDDDIAAILATEEGDPNIQARDLMAARGNFNEKVKDAYRTEGFTDDDIDYLIEHGAQSLADIRGYIQRALQEADGDFADEAQGDSGPTFDEVDSTASDVKSTATEAPAQDKEYRYRSPFRPLWMGFGSAIGQEYTSINERTFSVKKRLTDEQVKQFELEPSDPEDPLNIRKRYEAFHQKLATEVDIYKGTKVTLGNGSVLIISTNIDPDYKEKFPYRITTINKEGVPTGHDVYHDFDEIAHALWTYSRDIKEIKRGETVPKEAPTPESAKGAEYYDTALTDLIDSADHTTVIPQGSPHYKLADGRVLSVESYNKLVDTGAQEGLGIVAEKKDKEPWEMTKDEYLKRSGSMQTHLERDDFVVRHLEDVGIGEPGLSVEGNRIVYRDDNGSPVGTASLFTRGGRNVVDDFGVLAQYRKKGIATKIIRKAIEMGYAEPYIGNAISGRIFHKIQIENAIKANKSIPKNVLKDYPDLEAKYFPKAPPKSTLNVEDKQTSMLDGEEGLTGQRDMFAEVTPEEEYNKANEEYKLVAKAYDEATKKYRNRTIGDEEYLVARRALDKANEAFDLAEKKYSDYLEKHPKKAKQKRETVDTQKDMFAEGENKPSNIAQQFVDTDSVHHVVFYNGKIVEMSYVKNPKEQFKYAGMRIQDNLGTGANPTNEGYIRTPKGEFFKITKGSKTAKKVTVDEILGTIKKRETVDTLQYDPSVDRYNGEKLTRGDILTDTYGNRYALDRANGFMLTIDKLGENNRVMDTTSVSVDKTDTTRYMALTRTGENLYGATETPSTVHDALIKASGIDTTGKSEAQVSDEVTAWLKGIAEEPKLFMERIDIKELKNPYRGALDVSPKNPVLAKKKLFGTMAAALRIKTESIKESSMDISREDSQVASSIAKVFGHKIIFVDVPVKSFGGMYYQGNIVINNSSKHHHGFIFSHELTHSLQSSSPDLYQSLIDVMINNEPGILEAYYNNNKLRFPSMLSKDNLRIVVDEFVADTVGEHMSEKSFWEKLYENIPEVVKSIYNTIRKIIRKLVINESVRTSKYFKDIKNVRDTIDSVMAEYARRSQAGEVANETLDSEVRFLATRPDYAAALEKRAPIKSRLYNMKHNSDESWFARNVTPFTTRLELINPQIKALFRQFRHIMKQQVMKDEIAIRPLLDATTRMTKEDQVYFEVARFWADGVMLQNLIKKYNIGKEYSAFRKVMDGIYDRATEVGMDINYLLHQHPRSVKDPSGLLNYLYASGDNETWGVISEAFRKAQEKQPDKPLTDEQKAHIADVVIRGYGERVTLSAPGNVHERRIKYGDPEVMQFYHEMNTATLTYIANMNKAIEARAFFGKRAGIAPGSGKKYRLAMKAFTGDQRAQYKADMEAMRKDYDAYRDSIAGMDDEKKSELIQEYRSTMRASVKALQAKQHKAYEQAKKDTRAKIFGRSDTTKEQELEVGIDSSIGAYVSKLITNKTIKPEQEGELTRLFQAFFNYRASAGIVDIFKNLGYATAMGNVGSALTQIQDLAWSMYNAGIYGSAGALGDAITGKSKYNQTTIALNKILEEYSNPTKMSLALNKLFKFTGFAAMDRIGKEVLINASMTKYENMAKTDEAGLRKKLQKMLPSNLVEQTILDLKSGQITDNTKLVALNTILDFQPADQGEVPVGYLLHPGGRVFYMMKTYYIKQFDVMRREAIWEIRDGNVAEGIKRLVHISFLLMLMGGSADFIKDFVFGRDFKFSDNMWENFLRLFGISRYATWKLRDEGFMGFIVAAFAPPLSVIETPRQDIMKSIAQYKKNQEIKADEREGTQKPFDVTKLETVKNIPLIGSNLYWWFGGGNTKVMNRRIADPIKKSKEKILTSDERAKFFEELKESRASGRITPQEARIKRAAFFRNQAKVRQVQRRKELSKQS